MRLSGLALAATLMTAAAAFGQQSPPQLTPAAPPPAATAPAPAPLDPALESYLRRWEQEMAKVTSLGARVEQIQIDKVLKAPSKTEGIAYYMKVGTGPSARNLALLEMHPVGSKEIAMKFICTGTFIYEFAPGTREVRAHEMPKARPGQASDDNLLGFMFGMKAEEAQRRYGLKLDKEDQYYVYVSVVPRFPQDKADFQQARLVLNKATFLPVQLWFREPNGNEVTWVIPPHQVAVGMKMDQRWFDRPETPPGWKFVKVPPEADAPPKIIRNSGTP